MAQGNAIFYFDALSKLTEDQWSGVFNECRIHSDPARLVIIGWCYKNGQGVGKDEKEAVRLFKMAADQGNASAQNNLKKDGLKGVFLSVSAAHLLFSLCITLTHPSLSSSTLSHTQVEIR